MEKLVQALLAPAEILVRVQKQLLDKQVILHRVAEKNGCVDERVIEGMGVRLVFQQRLTVDAKEFQAHAHTVAETGVCSGMGRTIRETDHGLVLTGQRVDPLGVLRGKPTQDFHFRSYQPLALGMRIAHRPPNSLSRHRSGNIVPRALDDRLEGVIERGISTFKLRTVAYKVLCHVASSSL